MAWYFVWSCGSCSLSRQGMKVAFLKDVKEGTSRHLRGPQGLEKLTQTYSY